MGILIFWDNDVDREIRESAEKMISVILDMPVKSQENPVMLRGYDRTKNQNDASRILGDMQDFYTRRMGCGNSILIVTGKDLYIKGRDFVFGLARPGINVSIVSNARLKNSWYERQENTDDMIDRLVKEGTHELCHCMGLDHCSDPECIMYCPQTLDELDRKKKTLCEKCSQELNIYKFSESAFDDY